MTNKLSGAHPTVLCLREVRVVEVTGANGYPYLVTFNSQGGALRILSVWETASGHKELRVVWNITHQRPLRADFRLLIMQAAATPKETAQ